MIGYFKKVLKQVIPRSVHHLYNRVVSKRIILKRLGDWFDADWKRKATDADEKTWVEVYNRSWENWDEHDLTEEDIHRICESIPCNASILDVGCGNGYLLKKLTEVTNNVTGADLSGVALRRAATRLEASAELIQCSAEYLPFQDKSFQVVVSVHTLEHVRDIGNAVNELKRVSSDKLIILVPSQEYLPYTEDYHLHFFPHRQDLIDAVGLPRAKCIRYRSSAEEGIFDGDALLLIAEKIHD